VIVTLYLESLSDRSIRKRSVASLTRLSMILGPTNGTATLNEY
jgi:hypothetical protein